MNVDINIYTVQVAGEYHSDADSYIQSLFDKRPEKRCEVGSWITRHYMPKGWKPETEGQKWTEWAEANPEAVYQDYPRWESFEVDMDQTEFLEYCQHIKNPTITKSRVQKVAIPEEMVPQQLTNQAMLMDQVLNLNERCIEQLTRASVLCFNEKVGVPQPGLGLDKYNSLMLAEDICTDSLQGLLDDGWRILAICPQPDSRRPDYILGRYNKDHREGHGAERG